jgi:hypothetical protein
MNTKEKEREKRGVVLIYIYNKIMYKKREKISGLGCVKGVTE